MRPEIFKRHHTEVGSSTDPNFIKRELFRKVPKEVLPGLKEAVIFAEQAHKGQRREQEDGPVIIHPLRATYSMVLDGVTDIEALQTCVLHDVLEDNPTIAPEEIEDRFGKKVRDNVVLLSKEIQGVFKDLDEYNSDLESHPEVGEIKIYDRTDNMQAWARFEGKDTKRDYKILETLHFIFPLAGSNEVLLSRLKAALQAADAKSSRKRITEADVALEEPFLRERLRSHGINVDLWGQGATRTVRDLARELLTKESTLEEGNDGSLLRRTSIVSVDVIFEDPNIGKTYHLKEDYQKFRGGAKRKRPIPRSLSEKLRSYDSADILSTIRRTCAEELQIFNIDERDVAIGNMETETRVSKGYSGLTTTFKICPAVVRLRPSQFKPEGYSETQPDKSTYFAWTESSQDGASV